MPKYRITRQSFLNNGLHEEGAIVEYDGDVHDNLVLVEDESKPKGRGKKAAESADDQQEQAGE
jgi:hypothetical protein